jgi:hypothetical protein
VKDTGGGGVDDANRLPHDVQKLAAAGRLAEQLGQVMVSDTRPPRR